MTKAIRVIRIGEGDVAFFGVRHAFPPPVLMQRDRIGISQVELIGIEAVDQDRTAHPLLFSVTVRPLRSWHDRIARKCAAQHLQHAVALFA